METSISNSLPPLEMLLSNDSSKFSPKVKSTRVASLVEQRILKIVLHFKEKLSPFYYNGSAEISFEGYIQLHRILCTGSVENGEFTFSSFQANSTKEISPQNENAPIVIYRNFKRDDEMSSKEKGDEGLFKYYVPVKSLSLEMKPEKLSQEDQFVLEQSIQYINELIKKHWLDKKN